MNAKSPAQQLAGFIARFRPEIAVLIRAARARMRKRLPGAVEMVYDNTYALVVGFGATERPSEALFSIVTSPRRVSLCFLQGASLPDPGRLFNASLEAGTRRAIDIHEGETVDARAFKTLIKAAAAHNGSPAKATRRRA